MSNSERRSRSDISKASTSIENYNKRIRMLKKSKDTDYDPSTRNKKMEGYIPYALRK